MRKPSIGGPSDEYRAVCLYSGPEPGPASCGAPAQTHLMIESAARGVVAVATCSRHDSIARAAGTVLYEHEYQVLCGLPSTLWHLALNVCILDDSGEEPELVGALPGLYEEEEKP